MTRPLDGTLVLDFSRVLSGPHCGARLVDLGAAVVKIEPPAGDLTRSFRPRPGSMSAFHAQQNTGKRNLSLDLSRPVAVDLVRRLADRADVVLENFRPGVMDRMGLGYDELARRNPRLVYASISGYGSDGPLSGRGAYARSAQAEAGYVHAQSTASGRPPVADAWSHADVYTALECLGGILAALLQRNRTGRGQRVEVSMIESMLSANEHVATDLLIGEEAAVADGSAGRGRDPLLRTADGRWVQIVGNPATDVLFATYCRIMDRPELAGDPRFVDERSRAAHLPDLMAVLQEFVLGLPSVDDVVAAFGSERLAVGVVRSLEEVAASDWAAARGAIVAIPDRAGGTIPVPRPPWRFSDADVGVGAEPAWRGEHNRAVLHGLLGLDDDELDRLEADGVLSSRLPRRSI